MGSFDRIHHDRLISRLSQQVSDKRLLRLIGIILRSGILADGVVSPSTEGAVQGSPLSPLLSNIVLDELDKELERRGLEFCRFADDCNIFVRSPKAAERVMGEYQQIYREATEAGGQPREEPGGSLGSGEVSRHDDCRRGDSDIAPGIAVGHAQSQGANPERNPSDFWRRPWSGSTSGT